MALKDTARRIATALGAIANPSQSLAQGQALHAALSEAGATSAEKVAVIKALAVDPVDGIHQVLAIGRRQGQIAAKHFDGVDGPALQSEAATHKAQVETLTTETQSLVAAVAKAKSERDTANADVDARIRKAASTRAMELMYGLGVPPIAELKTPTTTPGGNTGSQSVKDIFAAQVRKAGGSN